MKIIRLITVIMFLLITLSCSVFKFLKGDWVKTIDLNKIRESFEKMQNVRVIKVFYDDVDHDWAGAVIVIDENKLLILRHFREEDISKEITSYVEIARIGNYRVSNYSYNPDVYISNQVYRLNLILGRDIIFYNTLLGLGEIKNIESIINNYDLILHGVEQLPDDDGVFWNPHDLESKSSLLHFTFDNGHESKIGKIKFDEINDYSILDENIKYWDLIVY